MFPYCQIEGGRMMGTEDGGGRGDEEVNDTREGGEKKEKKNFSYISSNLLLRQCKVLVLFEYVCNHCNINIGS